MYKKGSALELQFSSHRLNDGAGDPYWIDLDEDEARTLMVALQNRFATQRSDTAPPLVISLDEPGNPAHERIDDSSGTTSPSMTDAGGVPRASDIEFKQWVCVICGWIYDEAAGVPDEGIPAGTRWADVPQDWRCPLCDVGKEDFALVEF